MHVFSRAAHMDLYSLNRWSGHDQAGGDITPRKEIFMVASTLSWAAWA